jgi:class 3 adenylate cyclase/tetratricopeptide (TPR) repeat protein
LNASGHRFCTKCGQPLTLATGARVVGDRFASPESSAPKHLVETILTSRTALEGERKQVTVLFADLKGSMELLAGRDPEEARKLLDPVIERMMDAVHHYEGTVNQVMGDGIMALFGAPLAHEDHAVRACYAALQMQDAVRQYAENVSRVGDALVQIRVGIHSGEAVVRSVGSDLRMDYTAVGKTTHLAARMEQLAPPGAVYVTASVLRLVQGQVIARAVGPTPVKGLSSPVDIWEILGPGPASARFEAGTSFGLTPFVGRDEPLQQLSSGLALAERGEGQVIAVVGEAGVGKSRLFWEFLLRHVTSASTVLRGRSVSYGKASPYLPIVELLKRRFQITETDTSAAITTRVGEALASLDGALVPYVPALLAVLGVPSDDRQWEQLDPPQRREAVLEALRHLLLRLALDRPVVLVVEDLHWIDDGTQEVLDTLVNALSTARILLLVNYRPEYQHGWAGKSFYAQVRLDPLPADVSAGFLDTLLGSDVTLGDLKRALVERTQGNPFFLEESVRHLVETDVLTGEPGAYRVGRHGVRIEVPVTVQGVLAARIDRLLPDDKRLLQAASVVGKDVPLRALETIAEIQGSELRRALGRLQRAELLRKVRTFPESLYTFRHALTHEVTYSTLLGDRKRALHRTVLDAMERLYATRLTEHVEVLANHALRGEVWEKAVDYLRGASDKAYTRGALAESGAYAEQALDISKRLAPNPENIRRRIDATLNLWTPFVASGQFQRLIPSIGEAEILAQELGDGTRLSRVWVRLSGIRLLEARYTEELDYARQALESSAATQDAEIRLAAMVQLGLANHSLGNYATAIAHFRKIVDGPEAELAKRRFGSHLAPYVTATAWLAWGCAVVGNFDLSFSYAAHCIETTESSAPVAQAVARIFSALAFAYRGDFGQARGQAEMAVQLCETRGVLTYLSAAYAVWGWVLSWSVSPSEGLPYLERAVDIHEATGLKLYLPRMYRFWADALFLAGDQDAARQKAQHALDLAKEFGERGEKAQTLVLLADIAAGGVDENVAGAFYGEARRLAEELGMRPFVAHCHYGIGKLHHRTGHERRALEHLTTAGAMYREMDMQFWLEKVEAEMKELP